MDPQRWALISDHFDAALALPPSDRDAFVANIQDAEARAEVASLLRAQLAAPSFMEATPEAELTQATPLATLSAGACLGVWRIVRFIGHGGMGEVYEAARVELHFEQRAALKVMRHDAAPYAARFDSERRILARLDHPGVARLLDGGIAPDGRPYAVMEYVEGASLLEHCDAVGAGLETRLGLFMQVCAAVAFAHRNLVVHCDIKSSNVLVDRDGRTRLLDFGIAKLLDSTAMGSASGTATTRFLSPSNAAPEQLDGEPVTTATDVYALGLLLFQLLLGRLPWNSSGRSLGRAAASLMDRIPPTASSVAASTPDTRTTPRALQGDLDAIVAKCLRPEPEQRYPTVNALLQDLERRQRGEPIAARSGAQLYVLGRLARRFRWPLIGTAAVVATLCVGIVATMWQAERAEREAARATAARNFLVDVFKANDPRVAQDKPRGQVTARELLDASVGKIDQRFATDPETRIELRGVAMDIYRELGEFERYEKHQREYTALAREHYGETHPIVLGALLDEAAWRIDRVERDQAAQLVAKVDPLIRRSGQDQSVLRARWWLIHGQTIFFDGSREDEQIAALQNAEALFARHARLHSGRVTALADLGVVYQHQLNLPASRDYSKRAIALAEQIEGRNDAELAIIYGNLGLTLSYMGDFAAAEAAYANAEQVVLRTYGKGHSDHWYNAGHRARAAHLGGDRERADALFAELFKIVPSEAAAHSAFVVQEDFGSCLAAEGRPQLALPHIQAAERFFAQSPMYDFDLPRVRLVLGDALDRLGRVDEARKTLSWTLERRIATRPPEHQALLAARERWGRFLLSQGDDSGAAKQFSEVIARGSSRKLSHVALAQAGMARVALKRDDLEAALEASAVALEMFDQVVGFRDVRMGPHVWLARSEVLRRSGDQPGALRWAEKALAASRRYDDPSAASIIEAEAAVRAAAGMITSFR